MAATAEASHACGAPPGRRRGNRGILALASLRVRQEAARAEARRAAGQD